MQTSTIYVKDSYKASYEWLINIPIKEYDLEKANISILKELKLIDDKQYQYYLNLPKQKREIQIGLMLRNNPDISKSLSKGFEYARKLFLESNNIEDSDILYIDKDSITLIGKLVKNERVSENLNFRLKNQYTSYYSLFGIDLLYYNDNIVEYCRFKYVNDEKIKKLHMDYMVDILLSLAYSAQNDSILDTIHLLKNIYHTYINRKFRLPYYREFNNQSHYRFIKNEFSSYSVAELSMYTDLNLLDINYNASLLRLLYKYYTRMYFMNNKR